MSRWVGYGSAVAIAIRRWKKTGCYLSHIDSDATKELQTLQIDAKVASRGGFAEFTETIIVY